MTSEPTPNPLDDQDPAAPARTGIRPKYLVFMSAALVLLVTSVVLVAVVATTGDDDETGEALVVNSDDATYATLAPEIAADGTITYVIPAGTRARIAAGEDIAVIPASITIGVGQKLVLRNEDDSAHIAGPFFVGAGEESSYSFSEPKVIAGECTIHPSGQFEIRVEA